MALIHFNHLNIINIRINTVHAFNSRDVHLGAVGEAGPHLSILKRKKVNYKI